MARIRTIKPEFPQSESMGRVSRDARLLFVLLWTICDDAGKARAPSRMLASLLYPYDDDAPKLIGGWLDELEREGCIVRYEVDGNSYLQVTKWLEHQKIDHPSKSRLPDPREDSRKIARPAEILASDLGPRTKDLGKDSVPIGTAAPSAAPSKNPEADAYREGKRVLGHSAGGLVKKLRDHCDGDWLAVMDLIRQSEAKAVPREWISAVLRGTEEARTPEHIRCPPEIYRGLD